MDGKEKSSEPFMWVEEYSNFEWQQQKQYQHARKKKRMEFVGWASKPLIQFLESIGRDTTNPISQIDVTAIVNDYVDRNVLQPETKGFNFYTQSLIKSKTPKKKKKRVLCDARLRALFGRKSISRVMIFKLLERHLAEANELIDSDESHDFISEDEDEDEDEARKGQRGDDEELNAKHVKSVHKKRVIVETETPKTGFAAVIPQNIKLVYLKRSLVREILKAESDFVEMEMKVIGCFVRIKSDPNDCLHKHSHHLLQVSGVKRGSVNEGDENNVVLYASDMIKDIPIAALSDEDFTQEECDDLNQKMKDGILKRLTVEELQQKAHMLHDNITKHWLARELALLQNLIDRANEKGWRRELFEYLERRELLQTREEQSRLLSELPKVVAEEIEPEVSTLCPDEVEEMKDCLLESIPRRPTEAAASFSDNNDDEFELTWACDYSSEDNEAVVEPRAAELVQECDSEPENSTTDRPGICETKDANEIESETQRAIKQEVTEVESKTPQRVIEQEVIDLSDDDENEPLLDQVQTSVTVSISEGTIWHYLDPQGDIQGPFSMASLKRWSEADYFPPDFRIWKTGQSPDESVYLKDILSRDLPN